MKPPTGLLMSVILCAAIPALADTEAKKVGRQKPPKTSPVKPKAPETGSITLTTGTRLPREVSRSGRITDGPSEVLIYDTDTIRNSGTSDLAAFLRKQGLR